MIKNLFPRKMKTLDTRRFKRFRADFLVKYGKSQDVPSRVTNTRDIGAGGIRFWSEEKLPESSLLNVSVYLPPLERVVDGVARVLRVRRVKKTPLYTIATSFLELQRENREAINEFAESLSQKKGAQFLIDHANRVVRKV